MKTINQLLGDWAVCLGLAILCGAVLYSGTDMSRIISFCMGFHVARFFVFATKSQ